MPSKGLPRWFEVAVALAVLLVVAPVLCVLALLVRLTSHGPALFRQTRVGKEGRPFAFMKFRSMSMERAGTLVTAAGDLRVTPVGQFLRRTKLDELPALWHVVTGKMSLVGPRPEIPEMVDLTDPLWREALSARPGVTDPVTLYLRNEEELLAEAKERGGDVEVFYRDKLQRWKLRGYAAYLRQQSPWSDLKALGRTMTAVVVGRAPKSPSYDEIVRWRMREEGSTTKWSSVFGRRWQRILDRRVQVGFDVIAITGSLVLAYVLRFEFAIPHPEIHNLLVQLPYVVAVQIASLYLFDIYNLIWRYVGLAELRKFVGAAAVGSVPLFLGRILLPHALQDFRVPVSVTLMTAILGFGAVLGLRVVRRIVYERSEKAETAQERSRDGRKPVLLVGAGRAGVLAVREILGWGDVGIEVKGFVDDDPHKVGSVIHDVKVLGTPEEIPRLVRELQIDHVVITIGKGSRTEILRIVEICDRASVKVRIIPGLYDILQDRVILNPIRNIEIEDLLGRDPVRLDVAGLPGFLGGVTVMVTGAGGSIGSELVRQAAQHEPKRLLLVERSEPLLFEIEQEMTRQHASIEVVPLIADICDVERMKQLFSEYRPEVVLHAAAHKHVPMMECNAGEAVKNNVVGTLRLGEVAGESGCGTFVLVSSDKAVNPSSVMGACKRVAEMVVQCLQEKYPTKFVAVRFGNVLGSTGSVIPIFKEQIRRGGPVTVTHPDMMRYFMTISEAAQLVLQAGAIGEGGEIFILDMGKPVKIVDVARDMIRLSGLRPDEDIEVQFIGVRPGEKLFEELETSADKVDKTRHPKIFVGRSPAVEAATVLAAVERLADAADGTAEQPLRDLLSALVPEARLGPAIRRAASGAILGCREDDVKPYEAVPSGRLERAGEPGEDS